MVLLPYQQAWVADTSPVKVAEKSRRVGLSWAEAGDSVLLAAAATGMDTWYIGYNKDMAQEFIRDCGDWAKQYQIAVASVEESLFADDDPDKCILAYTIRFASGYRITALSSRPSNLRGKQGRVIIDEAAFHGELDELLKAAMALLIWGGQVHIISTHNGVDNLFNGLINDVRAGKYPYSLHRIPFDEAVEQGLYRRVCLVRGIPWTPEGEADWVAQTRAQYGDAASEELDCVPRNSGGAWLSRALIESRMTPATPVLRWQQDDAFALQNDDLRARTTEDWVRDNLIPALALIPSGVRCWVGEDFGRSGDLTVLAPLWRDQQLARHCPFVVELRNIPFRQQEQILFALLDRLPSFAGAAMDGRGNGQYLAEVAQQRYGSRVEAVMLSEGWYRDHMPPFKAALEDGTLTDLPRDADVLDDLRAIQMVRGVARIPDARAKGQDGHKRHGDAAIALVLAHYASRSEHETYDYTPATEHSRRDDDDNRGLTFKEGAF